MQGRRKRKMLNSSEIARALLRISHEILERNKGPKDLVVIGIPEPGPYLAARICENIKKVEGVEIPMGRLDITFHRDDIDAKPAPMPKGTDLSFDIQGKTIVLVDDVLYTGRTVRAALDALVDHGRPARVQLAVLIDRGHRELPVKADFVGRNIPTGEFEQIHVLLTEMGEGADEVFITEGKL